MNYIEVTGDNKIKYFINPKNIASIRREPNFELDHKVGVTVITSAQGVETWCHEKVEDVLDQIENIQENQNTNLKESVINIVNYYIQHTRQ